MAEANRVTYLQVTPHGDHVDVRLSLPTLTLEHRHRVSRSVERLYAKRLGRLGEKAEHGGCRIPAHPDLTTTLSRLDEHIAAIVGAPISGRAVEHALRITGEERRRWTRDGRLPTCAKMVTGRSEQLFAVSLYSPELVEQLAGNQSRIAVWRRMDAGAQQ